MQAISVVRRGVLGAALTLLANQAVAADIQRGAQLFRQCAACHSLKAGEHLTGPSLANFWGRQAGSDESFRRYSDALGRSKVSWDEATLDRWLADPAGFIPGNQMAFRGIKDREARRDLIAYLESASKAPAGGETMHRSPRADLRNAGPDSRVRSLTHCGDTYTVRTEDGETHKIWEFNLRLKTDSSEYGPGSGKPVVTGSGMMGDRASIVFAKPSQISPFITESCD